MDVSRVCSPPVGISHKRSSLSPPSPSSLRLLVSVASMRLEDELRWQPVFRLETDDLIADAPSLPRNCDELDWKRQASDLRALAKLNLDDRDCLLTPKEAEAKGSEEDDNEHNGHPLYMISLLLAVTSFNCGFLLFEAFALQDHGEQGAFMSTLSVALVSPAVYAACQTQVRLEIYSECKNYNDNIKRKYMSIAGKSTS